MVGRDALYSHRYLGASLCVYRPMTTTTLLLRCSSIDSTLLKRASLRSFLITSSFKSFKSFKSFVRLLSHCSAPYLEVKKGYGFGARGVENGYVVLEDLVRKEYGFGINGEEIW